MRKGLRGLLIGVGLALLVAAAVGGAVFFLVRPQVAGGKVLTYEVRDDELTQGQMRALTDQLKQRIDPKGRNAVVVRPGENNRVEILVPFFSHGDDDEYLDDVRQMVRQTGLLEFRILANPEDDREAIEETQRSIDEPTAVARFDLQTAADQGLPPLAPNGQFRVKVGLGDEEAVSYLWVEIGEEERESLALNEKYEGVGKKLIRRDGESFTTDLFDRVAKTRGKTFLQGTRGTGSLLFSRDRVKPRPGDTGKRVDYFYLTRDSPVDALAVTGDAKLTAFVTKDYEERPAVMFEFTAGAERFTRMTQRNSGNDGTQRALAIILDGKIVSAPILNGPLPGRGVISGNFDVRSAHRLASILNAGALPVELKPDPVFETPLSPADEAATREAANGPAARTGSILAATAFAIVLCAWIVVCLQLGRRSRAGR